MMLMLLSAFFFCHVMLTDNAVERSLFWRCLYSCVFSPFGTLRQPYLVMVLTDTLVHQDRTLR